VVIVTGGYNNVTGLGKVFFLDATNGTLISTVTTSAGSATDPSGLAQIHAFVKTQSNQIAEQIYGGDLLGNFWRIDVSADDSYKSATAELFATLTDPSGVPQPVTTAPQIEIDINNGVDRYVFIGTGRLLHDSDLVTPSPPQTQTMYAMRDGTLNQIMTSGLPVVPRTDLVPINPDGVSAIVGGAPNGWYHDLPNVVGDAERIVVDVTADVNIAAYIGTRVQDDPCLIALPGRLYAHDYTSGRSLLLDSGGTVIAYLNLPAGGTSVTIVGRIQADGTQTLGAVAGKGDASGGIETADIRNPVTGPGSRLSWRLLAPE
jgi:type IV pilus assembly protein PilY1